MQECPSSVGVVVKVYVPSERLDVKVKPEAKLKVLVSDMLTVNVESRTYRETTECHVFRCWTVEEDV